MFIVHLLLFWLAFDKTLGRCPTMKDPCLLGGFQYTGMCNCATDPPQHCTRPEEKCNACVFQGSVCSNEPGGPKCCPILSGQAYCNSRTKKCEAIGYCTGANCPFDDLSPQEIKSAVNVIQSSNIFLPGQIQFPVIRTLEPSKSDWIAGKPNQRIAYVAALDILTYNLFEILVDLTRQKIISKTALPGQLPPITTADAQAALKLARADPRVQFAYQRRGLKLEQGWFTYHPAGATGLGINQRWLRLVAYHTDSKAGWRWRAIAGFQLTVDLQNMKVIEVLDTEKLPITPTPQIVDTPIAPPLKPLKISQPEGSSIEVKGQQISWYKWKFMYSMDPIHGLQLFHVRYQADCEERLVLYKISISEMLVPYGAESAQWRWRRFLDAGEYGLGFMSQSQILGKNVPENSVLLNCTQYEAASGVPSPTNPKVLEGCIAAYERDSQMLVNYVDIETGKEFRRSGRQMVLSTLSVIDNYAYVFEYIFHMDGVLQVNVRLTGIVLIRGVSTTKNDPSCLESCTTLIDNYTIAPIHQHFFNYRIDLDVDGPQNYVLQSDVSLDPRGPENPDGGAFSAKKKIVETESAHDANIKKSRTWHVVNANSRNRFNSPRGYVIKPDTVAYHFVNRYNPYISRTEFVRHAFWATVHKDEEQGAAGTFPRSGIPYQGLPEYIQNKESLENEDVVVWHTFGLTHVTRPEEWPIMNVHNAGFSLVPFNFVSQNPEVPQKKHCS